MSYLFPCLVFSFRIFFYSLGAILREFACYKNLKYFTDIVLIGNSKLDDIAIILFLFFHYFLLHLETSYFILFFYLHFVMAGTVSHA
jgi:hypothetical protein